MRQLLFAFILLFSISIISCSDSGTGPNNEDTTTYSVSVDISPSEAGSISPSAEDDYEEGEEIELQANPNDGYVFTEWSGDIESTDNPHSLTVDQDYNITANFEIKSYELTINKEGEGSVNERIVQQKSTEYDHGTVVELTAEPQEGYEFVEWQGDLSGTENPSQITIDNPKEVTAVFEVATYPLSIEVSGEGSVAVTPDQEEYEYGTEVELLAEPSSSDWEFESWDGDTTSTNNPITVSIDSTINIDALFTHSIFAGGNGSEANPFQVSTVEQLQSINEYTNDHFVQINNIDASATENWNDGKGFNPIGDEVVKFTGSYDGDDFNISNLYINRLNQENVGLFGYTEDGNIENINITNIDVMGDSFVGGLVGRNFSSISNISLNGTIHSNNRNVGALAGYSRGSIENSHASGTVSSSGTETGGLVGSQFGGEILNSSADVSVKADGRYGRTGGLIGSNTGSIIDSYAKGNVENIGENHESGGYSVGGLAGWNDGNIENSYATGRVHGKERVGGLVGMNQRGDIISSFASGNVIGMQNKIGGLVGQNGLNSSIENSYALGKVEGDEEVGGLAGINMDDGTISNSYSIGQVLGNTDIGGLVGTNGSTINGSYWDKENSNQNEGIGRGVSDGTTGLTTSEMTGNSAEDNMTEFDWTEIWVTTENYPALFWE
ncbi:InlB B-repeat-containing protein [Rhodohalobacter halophilus]|uniref:InlB B-repeat-containing protein n=1 Tax=Rhodohalobacter halophilus TaxID=1812810 RepID=UPI00083FC451|nr:GLUG motif-containing protein [Rhodohalobacter halophilus]